MSSTDQPPRKVIPIAAAPADSSESEELVSFYEARKKIYPRSISGIFARWRWAMVFLTQLAFYGLPWLQWGERQLVLFDLGARRFYIFGLVLYPQDFIYLTGLLIISALSLFLFTAVAGRLWCGFACPQTVYTEIFMWIEHKVEGDRTARLRLDAGPWNFEKIRKNFSSNFCGLPLLCGPGLPSSVILCRFVSWVANCWPCKAGGRFSGFCFMVLPPMAMPASCASRCANTCVLMRAFKAPCSIRIL